MKFVKLGKRFINLDLVTNLEFAADTDESISINFGATIEYAFGEEAAALRHYLDGNSDNVVSAYTRYLENEERVKKANAAEQQFQAFCTDKDLSNEEKYSFRYWLQNEELEWPTNEEAYQHWREWQSDKFEEQINYTVKAANIPANRIEEFKEYCKKNGIAQPQYYEGLQFLQLKEKTASKF